MTATRTTNPSPTPAHDQPDRPWLSRTVRRQVTVPFQTFLNSLLPEHIDYGIGEAINESSLNLRLEKLPGILQVNYQAGSAHHLPDVASFKEPIHAFVCQHRVCLDEKNHDAQLKDKWYLCAETASHIMSAGLPRHHIFGVYVEYEEATFLYYDHSIVIVSEPLNWVEDQQFWNAIYIISYNEPEKLGFVAEFFTSESQNRTLRINGLDLESIAVIKASEGIIGECTSLVHARIVSGSRKDEVVTVRFNYIVQRKGQYEEDIIRQLYKRANRRRRSRAKRVFENIKLIKKKRWLRVETIPTVTTSQVYLPSSGIQERIVRMLGGLYEPRELRATVYAGELYPVNTLTNPIEIVKVFRDILKCQYRLFNRMNIVHRSLTPDKILCYKGRDDIHGVLTGFEYCAHVDDIRSPCSYLQSIEARPFISPDIFKIYNSPRKHLLRYEHESLYYVLIFLVTHFENGKLLQEIKAPYNAWFTDDPLRAAESKIKYNKPEKPTHLNITSTFEKLKPFADGLHWLLHLLYYHQRKELAESLYGSFDLYLYDEIKRERGVSGLNIVDRDDVL